MGKLTTAQGAILMVSYVPNIETLGHVWLADGVLLYQENPIARQRLGEMLKHWARRWMLKLDSKQFLDRLQLGDGPRWEMEAVTTKSEAP